MAFYVGQKVVCVDASNRPGRRWYPGEAPVEGSVYTIVGVRASKKPERAPFVLAFKELERCEEMRAWLIERGRKDWPGYGSNRFRPLVERKTDISIFKAMLSPSDARVDA